jgi:hypothetical protein
MPKGPHEQRLDGYVTGGKVDNIRHSAHVWDAGHHVLANLATALESAKPQLMDRFGPQTGPAAVKAFQKVADNVRAQANEMKKASTALGSAGDALEDAQTTHHKLGNAPASPPTDPTQKAGETSEGFHTRQKSAHAAQSHYATESADRERQSQSAIHDVDTKYDHAIQVMENIHGRPTPAGHGGGSGGGGPVPGGGLPPGTDTGGGGRHPQHTITGGVDYPGHHHTGGTDDGNDNGDDTGGGTTDLPPTYGDPGSPQGPGGFPTPGPGSTPPGGGLPPNAGHLPTGPTSTAIGGLLSGGIVGGTSGLTGAMRTSAMCALTAEEQAALASSRTTGAGASGVGAAGGRGGAVGMSGSSRGAGGGAGAGGRGGRGRKKKRPDGTDFFEDNEDWVDDDEAAPGVLH